MEGPNLKFNNSGWKSYQELTKDSPPSPIVVEASGLVEHKGEALDLGAGSLRNTKSLIEAGFEHVTAVDKEPVAENVLSSMPAGSARIVQCRFEEFDFPDRAYDLVVAHNSLPFADPDSFKALFDRIVLSLKEGGIFAGEIYGVRDGWNTGNGRGTFLEEEEARNLLAELSIIRMTEHEYEGETVQGRMKDWHYFEILARK